MLPQFELSFVDFNSQGGPGGSSVGFGNFAEIGPLDVNLKNRSTTWVIILITIVQSSSLTNV